MVELTKGEPQSADEYDDRTTQAVKSVLIDIAQVLGSFQGKFAVVGGAVPWLLLNNEEMGHVGTIDVDLTLHAEALGGGEYATLVEALKEAGYEQRDTHRVFQLVRTVPAKGGGPAIDVIVDFLMPRDAEIEKNDPPLVADFAVQRADGAELALRFYQMVAIEGDMIDGGKNRVEIAVASIPALLAMKGRALAGRKKLKDAYDIYYSIRNFPGGPEELAKVCQPVLATDDGKKGYAIIAEKFAEPDRMGPTYVRQFVEESKILGERSADQWQQDAFGQVTAWVKALGMTS